MILFYFPWFFTGTPLDVTRQHCFDDGHSLTCNGAFHYWSYRSLNNTCFGWRGCSSARKNLFYSKESCEEKCVIKAEKNSTGKANICTKISSKLTFLQYFFTWGGGYITKLQWIASCWFNNGIDKNQRRQRLLLWKSNFFGAKTHITGERHPEKNKNKIIGGGH